MTKTPTTSNRWTGIADTTARVRFRIGDRVQWDEGDRILYGTVDSFTVDSSLVIVKLDDSGSFVTWPTVSARLRRVPDAFPSDPAIEHTSEPTIPASDLADPTIRGR